MEILRNNLSFCQGCRCDGFDDGHECSDAGDCKDGKCVCDAYFWGDNCEIPSNWIRICY